jgi:hypothetical protein
LYEDALDSTWLDVAFDGFVNYSNGGQGTASHAGYPFDAVLTVRGGFPVFNPQLTFKILQNDVPAGHVASGTQANLELVLAGRVKAKLVVKSGNSINLTGRDGQVLCDHLHGSPGQVGMFLLY